MSKRCYKCQRDLAQEQFYRNKSKPDGRASQCIDCTKGFNRSYYENNAERLKDAAREYTAENGQDISDRLKEKRRNDGDAIRERDRERYAANPEPKKASNRRSYEANRESRLKAMEDYRESNREAINEKIQEWRAANPDKVAQYRLNRRARRQNATVDGQRIPTAAELTRLYGRACLVPGCEAEIATVDHVVPLAKGGSHSADNVQPLCHSCNARKGVKSTDYRHLYPEREFIESEVIYT